MTLRIRTRSGFGVLESSKSEHQASTVARMILNIRSRYEKIVYAKKNDRTVRSTAYHRCWERQYSHNLDWLTRVSQDVYENPLGVMRLQMRCVLESPRGDS